MSGVAFVDEQSFLTLSSSSGSSRQSSCKSLGSKGGILKRKTMEESLSCSSTAIGYNKTGGSSNGSLGTAVTFDSVEINEHPITLGDNPSVADGGPPIEIEWEAQSYEVTTVDEFEEIRLARIANRQWNRIRKLGPEERMNIVIKAGFSREELTKVEDDMSTQRLLREMTKRRAQRETALSASSSPAPSPTKSSPTRSSSQNGTGKPSEKSKESRTLIKRFRLRVPRRSFSS